MERVDKITRVLMMYSKLIQGGKIYKSAFCMEMNIDRRTFDRDIEDIRLFLSETYQGDELLYDREDESYHFKLSQSCKRLSGMELTFLMEILKGSGSLRKDEYMELISNLSETGYRHHRELLKGIIERHKRFYEENDKKAILKMQWDLQQCIAETEKIELHLLEGKPRKVCPVAIWIYEEEGYLFAYENEELRSYPFEKIEFFKVEGGKFDKRLIDRFDAIGEGGVKKRLEEIANEKN